MGTTYKDLFAAIGKAEGSGSYGAVNKAGYLGLYQFGELALIDAGFYTKDSTPGVNDWKSGNFSNLAKNYGVSSKMQFLASPTAQDAAMTNWMSKLYGYLGSYAVLAYDGQTINGIAITVSGLLGGSHLVGASALASWLKSGEQGTVPKDGNGTLVTTYMKNFGGYTTPFIVNHSTAETIVGSSGSDILNGRLGNDKLTGGGGADKFVFDSALSSTQNVDTITDFSRSQGDKIVLKSTIFSALIKGTTLSAADFYASATGVAHLKSDHILYNKTTGALAYDTDGTGPIAAIKFATLTKQPTLAASDFLLTT